MRLNRKIDMWLNDNRFFEFASRCMYQILHDSTNSASSRDRMHDCMVRLMTADERHQYVYLLYMTCKQNASILIKSNQRMDKMLWTWKKMVYNLLFLKFQIVGNIESLCVQSHQYVWVVL